MYIKVYFESEILRYAMCWVFNKYHTRRKASYNWHSEALCLISFQILPTTPDELQQYWTITERTLYIVWFSHLVVLFYAIFMDSDAKVPTWNHLTNLNAILSLAHLNVALPAP